MEQQPLKNEITLQSKQTTSLSLTEKGALIRDKYGDFEQQFMMMFTPSNRDNYPTLRDAVDGDTPSLVGVDLAYGDGSAVMWLYTQICEVLTFTGLRGNMTNAQIEATAKRIRSIAYHVTISEMMQFFSRFEDGCYDTFHGYNNPNPQIIMRSFKSFMEELFEVRSQAFMEEEGKERERRLAEAKKNAVPCPPELAKKIEALARKKFPTYRPMKERKINQLA